MTDFISLRLTRSPALATNVTPTSAPRNCNSNDVSPQERFLQHLTDLSGGNFLYAELTLELVERGHLVIKSNSFKVLPVSVSEVFLLELNLRWAQNKTRVTTHVLYFLKLSQVPQKIIF